MSNEREIKEFTSANGLRRAAITDLGNGRFRFIEEAETSVAGYTVMKPSHVSGYYDSAEAAEAEALATLPWIKAQI